MTTSASVAPSMPMPPSGMLINTSMVPQMYMQPVIGNQAVPQVLSNAQEQSRLHALLTAQAVMSQNNVNSVSAQPIMVNASGYGTTMMPSVPTPGNTQFMQPGNQTTGVAFGDPTQNPFYPYARRYVDEPALYTSFTNPADPSGRNQLANQQPAPVDRMCSFPSLPDGTGYSVGGGCGFMQPIDATPATVACAWTTAPGEACAGGCFESGYLRTINAIRQKSFQQDNATKSEFLRAARPIIM